MKHDDALKIANDMVDILKPGCLRIEVKGSICRLAAHVKDIDILAIPDLTPLPSPKPEFGKPLPPFHKTKVDEIIYSMRVKEEGQKAHWILQKNGDKKKQMYLLLQDISLELWLVTPPAEWGVLSVIRTGPADFGHWMVTRKSRGGALPDHLIVEDGAVGNRVRADKGDKREGVIATPEEEDFFRLCGMEWIEPNQRVARWGKGVK